MVKVGLYHCDTYDPKVIENLLEKSLQEQPEWLDNLKPNMKVLLKLNLLLKKKPEEAALTHPALVEAMASILIKRGAKVIICDSPGGPYNAARLKAIYRAIGLEEVAARTGAELNYDLREQHIEFPEGHVLKAFDLLSPIVEADLVINLPKLKTHQMTKYTGAVKNLFGSIPGLKKADYHLKMPALDSFCGMLVDLALCVKPQLHIMDGIVAMEGHGPSAGNPVAVGAILVSQDPFALDVAALELVKIPPRTVPTVNVAKKRGLVSSLEEIEIVGSPLEEWNIVPLVAPKIGDYARFSQVPEFVERALRPKPKFVAAKCVGCGECVRCCPAEAMVIKDGLPQVDLDLCIRCFCCQELCPQKAVVVKRNPLGRFLG